MILSLTGNHCQNHRKEEEEDEREKSGSTAYAIIKALNRELESMGYLTIRGKIERTYLEKRYGLNTDWTKNPP